MRDPQLSVLFTQVYSTFKHLPVSQREPLRDNLKKMFNMIDQTLGQG